MNAKDFSETSPRQLRFDYDQMSSSLASFLKTQADRIRKQSVTSIIQIGKALNESKRHLSHGTFLNWVEYEVCLPVRTAQAYMKVASWAADKSAAVACLSPSTLHVLSASNIPSEYVANILSRVENGEVIPNSAIRSELKALKSVQPGPGNLREAKMLRVVKEPASSPNFGGAALPSCLEELVALLVRVLSVADFERVRELVTSDAVLSDPRLSETLLRAFSSPENYCKGD